MGRAGFSVGSSKSRCCSTAWAWEGWWKTDWYRNAIAHPRLQVQVGRRSVDALAEPLPQQEVAGLLAEINRVNPAANQMWSRWAGFEVDGSPESLLRAAEHFPSLRLKVLKGEANELHDSPGAPG